MSSKIASGRIVKSLRARKAATKQQQHQHKAHRWESFRSKIAQLHSLDPLHKVRRHDLDDASAGDLSATTSFFRNGLENWADLNLTRSFTNFRRTVQPLSESLAQILHFEDRIFDELTTTIRTVIEVKDANGNRDREALEPLLDLLTAFAHDLGTRFVKHGYDTRAFALLVDVALLNGSAGGVAARQQNHKLDADVLEWTFACLAFLFKYLSRLLVADLRPTFDLLAPLLGRPHTPTSSSSSSSSSSSTTTTTTTTTRRRVPGHVARFAAEALSFLVRATANKTRREADLARLVRHIRDDLLRTAATAGTAAQRQQHVLYTQAIMTMFSETAKGPGDTLRLSADGLFAGLLRAIPADELRLPDGDAETSETPWTDVCCGVLTSLIHHSSPEQLQMLVDTTVAEAATAVKKVSESSGDSNISPWGLSVYVRLIGLLAGVRGGYKIKTWPPLVATVAQILEAMTASPALSTVSPATASLLWRTVLTNVAIVWNHAPLVLALQPQLQSFLRSLQREPFDRWFIPFCAYLAALNPVTFQSALREPFQAFVSARWSHDANEDILCAVLPGLVDNGAFPAPSGLGSSGSSKSTTASGFRLPQSWQDSIVSKFEQLEAIPFPERGVYGKDPATWRDHCLPKYAALLHVVDSLAVVHPSTPARISELLLRKLRLALRPTSPALAGNEETIFLVTQGFRSYCRMTRALAATPDPGLRPLLRAAAPRFARQTGFLEALLQYERLVPADDHQEQKKSSTVTTTTTTTTTPTHKHSKKDGAAVDGPGKEEREDDPLVRALVANLSAPSHVLRLVSLQLLQRIGMDTKDTLHITASDNAAEAAVAAAAAAASAMENMLQIEQIGFAPQNVRVFGAHLRKLAQLYSHVPADSWLQAAIPSYLFGMLSVPLSPVWDDAIKAMKQVAETNKTGEEAIASLALDWIDLSGRQQEDDDAVDEEPSAPSATKTNSTRDAVRNKKRGPVAGMHATDFVCFRYANLASAAAKLEHTATAPSALMRQAFQGQQQAAAAHADYARSKALKVFAAMPAMAEKRSRRIVPHLLSWTNDDSAATRLRMDGSGDDADEAEAERDGANGGEQGGWTFADKKALLLVFSLFTNGQVLYLGDKAYAAILKLLANGDIEIQRLALKSLLAWRQGVVVRYREQLENLLDESKFKNELTLLLQSDDESGSATGLQPRHRAELMPVLLRLLYGRTISKKGAASGRQGLHATRLFVIRNLDVEGIGGFLAVALGSLQGVQVVEDTGKAAATLRGGIFPPLPSAPGRHGRRDAAAPFDFDTGLLLPARKQVGVLNMLEPIINELGSSVTPFTETLVNATLYCLICACRGLQLAAGSAGVDRGDENTDDAEDVDDDEEEEAEEGDADEDAEASDDDDEAVDDENADSPQERTDVAVATETVAAIGGGSNTSLLRTAKTAALRCLCALFRNAGEFDWTPYRDVIVAEVISPGIDRLPQETTQGVSWTWRLLGTWAQLPQCALFLGVDRRILPKILESLSTRKAKDAVKIFALALVDNLVQLAQAPEAESPFRARIRSELMAPNMDAALLHLNHLLRSTTVAGAGADSGKDNGSNYNSGAEISRPLLEACVHTVVVLSPLVEASVHARGLVDIATWLLNQPPRRVNPRVKGALLLILERFIQLDSGIAQGGVGAGTEENAALRAKVFATVASLFSFFKDRENRESLCRVMAVFAEATADQLQLQAVAGLCFDLNSYAEGQLDEPDYDRRLRAFTAIVKRSQEDDGQAPFTPEQWLPLLHNMVFFLRVDEEYGVLASNAADGLIKYVEDATDAATHQPKDAGVAGGMAEQLKALILPALYAGARNPSETVRREGCRVFASLIAHLRAWAPVADLSSLVPEPKARKCSGAEDEKDDGDDDEDDAGDDAAETMDMDAVGLSDEDRDANRSFFHNILNPAIAKQIQAMQVLEGCNARHPLGSKNVNQFFVPLLEHFIFGREEGADDFGLGAQAANTIAQLSASLEWTQYRALLRRFLAYVESKPALQKQVVRLLDRVVDVLAVAAEQRREQKDAAADASTAAAPLRPLAATVPDAARLTEEILTHLTPALLAHLHDKDEETVSARVPVAIVVVKLLNLLPAEARDQKLAGVLTDVCHILRSKSWEARELARDTLAQIACILGPSCFQFVLQELRGALTRGYQLHVLSYTMHTLLLAVIPRFAAGELDGCVETMMAIIMDDVFGAAGQEKDEEGYISKMKEVKKSKSQDSLHLVAKNVSVRQLGLLVRPLHALMLERITKTIAAKIDTLLARIASGLAQNPAVAESRDVLVFCYELIRDVYASRAAAAAAPAGTGENSRQKALEQRTKKYLFQRTQRNNTGARVAGKFTYKLVQFALDLLRTVLRQYDSLRTAANLTGFIPMIGDAVLGGEEEVKIAAYKLLVVVAKVPFPEKADMRAFTGLYQVATKEAIRTVQTATTTTSDLAQAALKLVSVVLRSRHADVPVRAAAVDELLGKLKHDLTNPLFRHVTFNFVRAVLDRRVASAAVYDTLDYIGTVMITNDDGETRDLARRAFFQFLREYPQQRRRWERQLAFIVANFAYERESGRLSALEVVYKLLLKATDALPSARAAAADPFVQDIVAATFLPLVLVLGQDASAKCRRVAAAQLRAMLPVAKREYVNEFLRMFRAWLAEPAVEGPSLGKLNMGIEMFGLYFASWDDRRDGGGDDNNNNNYDHDAAATPVTALAVLAPTQAADLQAVLARLAAVLGDEALRRNPVFERLVATALQTAETLVAGFPVLALDTEAAGALWPGIEQCLWHSKHAIRMAAMRLVALYLSSFSMHGKQKTATPATTTTTTAMTNAYGMTLDDGTIATFVRGFLNVLSGRSGEDVEEAETEEAAKMLVHLAPYLQPEPEDDDEEEEDTDEDEDEDEDEGEEDEEDEEADAEDDDDATAGRGRRARPVDRRFVFLQLARVVRREAPPKVAALVPKAAALKVLDALCSARQPKKAAVAAGTWAAAAAPSGVAARALLRPLRNLTDPLVAAPASADPQFAARYDELKRRAVALMDTLQTRLGTAAYTRHLLAVGAAARDRRQQRASKRKIGAVTQPEKHGRDKRKKLDKKKERRKIRGQEHRGVRRGY